MAKIEDVITYVDKKITVLSALNHINVVKRIDEVVAMLKEIKAIAVGTQESQKFDLAVSAPNCTVTFTVDGQTVTAGSNVLTYGDELTITCVANTGYNLTTLKVNNQDFTSGSTITVTDNLSITASATLKTFNLIQTIGENCSASYSVGGESITAGTGVLTYGDVLTISCVADTGYDLATLTVNGEAFTSGSTITVTEDISVVATASIQTFDLTETLSENCSVVYSVGGEPITAGTDVLSYGDSLTITVTASEGFTIDTFTVNGTTATSGTPITVTSNIAVVVTTTAVL